MRLLWEESAWEEYCYWQLQDKKTLKRINTLIKDMQRSAFVGIGKIEPLKKILVAFGVAALMKYIGLLSIKKKMGRLLLLPVEGITRIKL